MVGGADLHHLAHEFMAHHVAALHRRHVAVQQMEVGTADGAGGDFHDDIARILDARIIDIVAADVAFAVPNQCFHGSSSSVADDQGRN